MDKKFLKSVSNMNRFTLLDLIIYKLFNQNSIY